MKRYIKSAVVAHRSNRTKLNYDATNKVVDYIENICESIEGNGYINMDLDFEYNQHTNYFDIRCVVGNESIIETPKGREFVVTNSGDGYIRADLTYPVEVNSEYGPIELCCPSSSYLDYTLLYLHVSNSSFEDCVIITDEGKMIDLVDVKYIIQHNLIELENRLDRGVDESYQNAVEYLVEERNKS